MTTPSVSVTLLAVDCLSVLAGYNLVNTRCFGYVSSLQYLDKQGYQPAIELTERATSTICGSGETQ